MWRFFAFLSALAVVGSQTAAAQPAFLVKDINTTSPLADSSSIAGSTYLFGMRDFVEHGGSLLFGANDGIQGRQLWASDATPAGTTLVAITANASVVLSELTPTTGGPMFFRTYTDLYRTDGTSGGTVSLYSSDPIPHQLTPLGSALFFVCSDTANKGQLCLSDGTPGGTGLLKEIQPPGSFAIFRLTVSGDLLFFTGTDATAGRELFKSDGTADGTADGTVLVRDIWAGGDSTPDRLTDVNGTLFFSALTGAGRELWKSDGTEDGTVLVKDIRPGADSSIQANNHWTGLFTAALDGTLFFIADDGASGSELWKSDGTADGTVLVKDIAPGGGGSDPYWLTRLGDRVYFVADDGAHGRELWVSDGTADGTRMVSDLLPGMGSSLPEHLQAVGHVLLFSATDGVNGVEPWRSNGTAAGTRRIQDIAPGALSSTPTRFTPVGAHVFFSANDNVTGHELWAVPKSAVLATFGDVPADFWAWQFVEALAAAGLTTGCAPGLFCPEPTVSRAETAAFLIRGSHGAGFTPPAATGAVFADVPASYWAASWIEQMFQDGLTTGCAAAPPRFCPEQPLTRAEMAVFLLRAKHGGAYNPPPAAGTVFTDVPANYWAAAWIEQLAAEGITTGCAPGLYCPDISVTRAQMAAFLTRTFSLPLP